MTGYENLSQVDLHSLFSTDQWSQLSPGDKLNACQEVENRYAAEFNVQPCTVAFDNIGNGTCGYQQGNMIYMDENMVCNGFSVVTYTENGQTYSDIEYMQGSNWVTLDTVYHEGTHGVQTEQGTLPSTYIGGEKSDWDIYRIQDCENQAYTNAAERTLNAIADVEKATGVVDANKEGYVSTVQAESLQGAIDRASINYNDINIQDTVNSVIQDRDNGIQPVNPSPSYKAISDMIDNQYSKQQSTSLDKLNEIQNVQTTAHTNAMQTGNQLNNTPVNNTEQTNPQVNSTEQTNTQVNSTEQTNAEISNTEQTGIQNTGTEFSAPTDNVTEHVSATETNENSINEFTNQTEQDNTVLTHSSSSGIDNEFSSNGPENEFSSIDQGNEFSSDGLGNEFSSIDQGNESSSNGLGNEFSSIEQGNEFSTNGLGNEFDNEFANDEPSNEASVDPSEDNDSNSEGNDYDPD